jgi:hypothetical protein
MENLERVKKVLKNREKAILSMAKKLDKANSLNRTLLDALSTAIGRDEVLNFEERKAIKEETVDVIDSMTFSMEKDVKIELS